MVAENPLIAHLTYSEYAQCELAGDLALVPEVAGKIRAYCFRRGLDPQTWATVELALVEGLNNAIEHGCRGVRDGCVRIRWNWTEETLTIEILDPGHFRLAPARARLPNPLSERGRGMFVMTTLMDRVSHEKHGKNHLLVLQKRLGPAVEMALDGAATLEGMIGELSNSYESITTLLHFGEELAAARSLDDFVGQALRRLLKRVCGNEAWLRLDDGGGGLKLVSPGQVPCRPGMPEFLPPESSSVEMLALHESEQHTVEDCAGLGEHDPLRRDLGCAFVCPILFREATIGVLSVVRAQTTPYFTAGETRLVGVVADFLGIARAMALSQEQRQAQQRTERELEIAAGIQQSLLPTTFPATGRFRIFGLSQTAHEVGGDYFDVLAIGDKGVLLAIADVMGKGMPAALLATILRTTIRAHAELAEDPGRLLTAVNRQLSGDLNNLGMFITAQLAFLSHETDELIFASAGHCPILKFPADVPCARLRRGEGVPLGVLDEAEYDSIHEPIARGDRIVFLTDGIYEAESAAGEILGLEALVHQIPTLCVGTPETSCRRLLEDVAGYSIGAPPTDDRTLLIAQRL